MSERLDSPPSKPEFRVEKKGRGGPYPFDACGKCGKRLPNDKVWRCPYVGCRVWLRGLDEIDEGPKRETIDGKDEPVTKKVLAFDFEAHA